MSSLVMLRWDSNERLDFCNHPLGGLRMSIFFRIISPYRDSGGKYRDHMMRRQHCSTEGVRCRRETKRGVSSRDGGSIDKTESVPRRRIRRGNGGSRLFSCSHLRLHPHHPYTAQPERKHWSRTMWSIRQVNHMADIVCRPQPAGSTG